MNRKNKNISIFIDGMEAGMNHCKTLIKECAVYSQKDDHWYIDGDLLTPYSENIKL